MTLSHEAENKIEDVNRLSELQEINDWGRTNYNLNFGGGLVFPAGAGEVLLEARYNFGLSDYDLEDGDVDGAHARRAVPAGLQLQRAGRRRKKDKHR